MTLSATHWLNREFDPAYWAKHHLSPVLRDQNLESILISEISNLSDLGRFRFLTGESYRLRASNPDDIDSELSLLQALLASEENESNGRGRSQELKPVPSSVILLVNDLMAEAIREGASDIHFEPFEKYLLVRYRVDGSLRETRRLDCDIKPMVISRLKIMGGLDIAERRLPQDGRIRFHIDEKVVDVRLSTLPTEFGEKAVLRILDKSALRLELESLGMSGSDLALFRKYLGRAHGIILVTGPTGSGKTTTLYSAINEIRSPELNITTIEDPIEYNLEGINQTQIKPEIGLNFAHTLRSILRQDPNIILVGEIRDSETLKIALRAALTGHLVLSTLHTNDSVSAISRLLDLEAERGLLATALRLVIAQRLVKVFCDHCKKRVNDNSGDNSDVYESVGCERCYGNGFSGRKAIFEFFEITESVMNAIETGASTTQLRKLSREEGINTLREAGVRMVANGETDMNQVIRESM